MAATNEHGRELWMSDGTANGTVLVKDIHMDMFHLFQHPIVYLKPMAIYFSEQMMESMEMNYGRQMVRHLELDFVEYFPRKENSYPGYYRKQ